jgi:NAD(P)-dependent dehydrogenase (short-subunit alcohol dehydrogenase family)
MGHGEGNQKSEIGNRKRRVWKGDGSMTAAKEAAGRSRVAVVTGANRGIGLEVSRQLAGLNFRVVMTGRDRGQIDKAARSLTGERVMPVQLDVTDTASIERAHRQIEDQLGGVDVLVNNAAILLHESSDVLAVPLDDYRRTFETNVFGAIQVCRAFVPAMARRRYGRVVNVSSGAGQLSRMSTYAPAYSMSKAALNALTRILAETYRGEGVLVNSVDPGWVRTDMGGSSAPRSVEEGADTIVWLATLPDSGPSGGFFHDRRRTEW